MSRERHAAAIERDRERIVRAAVRQAAGVEIRVRAAVLRAWRTGGGFSGVAATIREKFALLTPVVAETMLAAHLAGELRSVRAADAARRTLELDRPMDTAVDYFAKRLGISQAKLTEIVGRYGSAAASATGDAASALEGRVIKALAETTAEGGHLKSGVDAIRQAFDASGVAPKHDYQIESIMRTQTAIAYGAGRQIRNADPDIDSILWGYGYLTVGDDRVRPEHAAMDGHKAPKNDPIWRTWTPPCGYNCFVPGTLVEGAFVAGLHARYSGPVVTVKTARGHSVTVTINHPVLTARGWIRAGSLRKGDTLFSDSRVVESLDGGQHVDEHNGPSRIEDVVNALRSRGSASIETAPMDLYGDAAFFEGDVHVVGSDVQLRSNTDAHCSNGVGHISLKSADSPHSIAKGNSPLDPLGDGPHAAGCGLPRSATLALDCGPIHFDCPPLQRLGLVSSANTATSLDDQANDCGTRQPERHGDGLDRLSGFVAGANVSRVDAVTGQPLSGVAPESMQERQDGAHVNAELFGNRRASLSRVVHRTDSRGIRRETLCCGLSAHIDAVAVEKPDHLTAGHSAFLGKLTSGSSGAIASDDVVEIVHSHYSGVVYDGETVNGWILSGGIVTSNCRCTVYEIFYGDAEAEASPPPEPTEIDGELVTPGPDEGWGWNPADLYRGLVAVGV